MNLQIVSSNERSYEDYNVPPLILNSDCRDKELPANGDCDDGWQVMVNSTHSVPDQTASINCLECET